MMVALERYNKRAQWHPVNPSSPSSRVRLTSGTHQHNFIHTYTFEPLPPFKWTLQDSFTHFTQSCVHLLLLKGPTYRWNTSAQLIHTYTSYARLWTSSPFQVNTSAQLIHLTQSLSPTQGWDLRVQHFNRALYYASCFNSYEISLLQVVFCMNIKHNHSAKSQNQKDPWKSQTPHKPLLLCSRA